MTKVFASHSQRRKVYRVLPMFFIGLGLILLGIVGFILWPKPDQGNSTPVSSSATGSLIPAEVNFPAPQLTVSDLNGNPVSLVDYRGQVILVNNWATWCPPCKAEMPELQAYYEAHSDQGFKVVAIDAGDAAAEVKQFVQEYELTFDVLSDVHMHSLAAFRNSSLPSSYVIDDTGTVRLAWTGAIDREMLEKYVSPLLED